MRPDVAAAPPNPPPISDEAGRAATEAGHRGSESADGGPLVLDDVLARALGIPGFGIAIPQLTGLLDGIALGSVDWWLGSAGFVALAAAIWHGNRWLLFEQRRRLGWLDHPAQKVMMLLAAIVLYTVPITIVGLLAWFAAAGRIVDVTVIRTVVLMNVICVVFVTHAYETVFLVKERASDRVRVAELDRARSEAELAAFLAQVDPHFLFNSLNALGHLIDTDIARARRFADEMAALYRYPLRQRGRAMVPIDDELAFVGDYVALMRVRFGEGLQLRIVDAREGGGQLAPTTSLQLLVENAIKHNQLGEAQPLEVTITVDATAVIVENERRPRRSLQPGEGVGLRNLAERARLATGRALEIHEDAHRFRVVLPLGQS